MGKNKGGNKTSKNVFKVVGSRRFKQKNSAKPVSGNLTKKVQKLNIKVKETKMAEVNNLLDTLEVEVRCDTSKKKIDTTDLGKKKEEREKKIAERVKEFEETEKKTAECLDELSDMLMDS